MIRTRPSGLRRRLLLTAFAGAGVAAASALAFRTTAHRFFCAAPMRRRAAGLVTRFVATGAGGMACPPIPFRELAHPRLDVLELLLVADERRRQETRVNFEWHKQ